MFYLWAAAIEMLRLIATAMWWNNLCGRIPIYEHLRVFSGAAAI